MNLYKDKKSNKCTITAPIDISSNIQITNKCSTNCQYLANYSPNGYSINNISIINDSSFAYIDIEINGFVDRDKDMEYKGDNSDDTKYIIQSIQIRLSPRHTYSTYSSDIGELVIIHKSTKLTENNYIIVTIPIIVDKSPTLGSYIFENIIQVCSENQGEFTEYSITKQPTNIPVPKNIKINIHEIIPAAPFYTYKGYYDYINDANTSCPNMRFIVFSPENGITLNKNSKKLLLKLLSNGIDPPETVKNSNKIYYNSKGPKTIGDSDIYIDCKPVNQTTEKVYIPLQDEESSYLNSMFKEIGKIANTNIMGGIIGIMLILGLYFIIDKTLNLFKGIKEGEAMRIKLN